MIYYNTNTGWSLIETTKINHKYKLSRKKTKNKKAGKNNTKKEAARKDKKHLGNKYINVSGLIGRRKWK